MFSKSSTQSSVSKEFSNSYLTFDNSRNGVTKRVSTPDTKEICMQLTSSYKENLLGSTKVNQSEKSNSYTINSRNNIDDDGSGEPHIKDYPNNEKEKFAMFLKVLFGKYDPSQLLEIESYLCKDTTKTELLELLMMHYGISSSDINSIFNEVQTQLQTNLSNTNSKHHSRSKCTTPSVSKPLNRGRFELSKDVIRTIAYSSSHRDMVHIHSDQHFINMYNKLNRDNRQCSMDVISSGIFSGNSAKDSISQNIVGTKREHPCYNIPIKCTNAPSIAHTRDYQALYHSSFEGFRGNYLKLPTYPNNTNPTINHIISVLNDNEGHPLTQHNQGSTSRPIRTGECLFESRKPTVNRHVYNELGNLKNPSTNELLAVELDYFYSLYDSTATMPCNHNEQPKAHYHDPVQELKSIGLDLTEAPKPLNSSGLHSRDSQKLKREALDLSSLISVGKMLNK